MEFPGQGSDPSHSCNLYCCCNNARSFNPLCRAGDQTCVPALRDATDPVAPEQEILFLNIYLIFILLLFLSVPKAFRSSWARDWTQTRAVSSNPSLSSGSTGSISHWAREHLTLHSFFFFLLFRAAPTTYASSQARGWIGATAADLHHSHSNAGSEPRLRPTPQLKATPYP